MLKRKQKLGKYRIEQRLAQGGFSDVYQVYDEIEGVHLALKVPHEHLLSATMNELTREVRLSSKLEHPNILPIKNAGFIDNLFVIVYPLGLRSLEERLKKRMSLRTKIGFAQQMLEAVAHAHQHRIIHCDLKPDNFILFNGNSLRLADFGIAKVALSTRTLNEMGTGTVGYVAPEQAMGKPSFRSDVFSLGLILYRMFSGQLPSWPYNWPLVGLDRIKRTLLPEFIALLRRSLQVDERYRYDNAIQMHEAFLRIKPHALKISRERHRARTRNQKVPIWKSVRVSEFRRLYGKFFPLKGTCPNCGGGVNEAMRYCPWCGAEVRIYDGPTSFPRRCDRCGRGIKLNWKFCAWCYGPRIKDARTTRFSDVRYTSRCENQKCPGKDLMPFMRYCPWCHAKIRRKWKIEGMDSKCHYCELGLFAEFWQYCPWCGNHQ